MSSNWRNNLAKFLTVAYLVSAAVVTVATSKRPEGHDGEPGILNQANYSVRSNCKAPAANLVSAIHTNDGRITQSLDSDGVTRRSTVTDFSQLGFPQAKIVPGLNTYSNDNEQKCVVRSRQAIPNPKPSDLDVAFVFIQPGFLSTLIYDCYDRSAYVCSIQISELPAGTLSEVY